MEKMTRVIEKEPSVLTVPAVPPTLPAFSTTRGKAASAR